MSESISRFEDSVALFTCPQCGSVNSVDLSASCSQDRDLRVDITCQCKHTHPVVVDRRRNYRKMVHLDGYYTPLREAEKAHRHSMVVKSISTTGVQLQVDLNGTLAVGDRLMLEFDLDDGNTTHIEKEGLIRRIEGNTIGVKFCNTIVPGPVDRAIGFYIWVSTTLLGA
jgi:hypothetical protein